VNNKNKNFQELGCRGNFFIFFFTEKMDVEGSKKVRNMEISSDTSSTEEEHDVEMEEIIREEARSWLSLHATKLFGLEVSKYLALEAKRKNLRGMRK